MNANAPTAYPLAWPTGKQRTAPGRRTDSRFHETGMQYFDGRPSYRKKLPLTLAGARQRLMDELDRMGARYSVLSTNLDLRLDGLPRSGQRQPDDPGVAVYFQLDGKPIVLACDRYRKVEENVAAIAAHIDAMRTAERHGVGSFKEMFAGFTALPAPLAPDDWRKILLEPVTLEQAEAVYRERMKEAHPDVGGSNAEAAALNAAIALARQVLK